MPLSSVTYNSIDAAEDEDVVGKVTADPYIGTKLGTAREQFCAAMSNTAEGQAGEALKWIEEATRTQLTRGYMLTGELPCSVLQSLVMLSKAERVLEIGAYTGYSAVAMAATGAQVTTIDSFEDEPESEAIFHEGVRRSGLQIRLEKGKALAVLARLEQEVAKPFDLVFVDAEKRQQIAYYDFLMAHPRLWNPSGAICVDNTLWYSRVLRSKVEEGDDTTQAVVDFDRYVRNDPKSHVSLLPMRDGLTLIQRRRPPP
eukprot:CAMPEP_0177691838 /NCGR_PEP_ID=MMETSP0484_2-20121128/1526_1 /TAXON_ID=354590 /ORGANISM="Rhodomonas lens, Strain RHODO" /LENGTH=256 /DNA_ID=CAMNT_0019202501 /DNA_START=66 /DNA_END=836 /DNA_ORIENTATION=-